MRSVLWDKKIQIIGSNSNNKQLAVSYLSVCVYEWVRRRANVHHLPFLFCYSSSPAEAEAVTTVVCAGCQMLRLVQISHCEQQHAQTWCCGRGERHVPTPSYIPTASLPPFTSVSPWFPLVVLWAQALLIMWPSNGVSLVTEGLVCLQAKSLTWSLWFIPVAWKFFVID